MKYQAKVRSVVSSMKGNCKLSYATDTYVPREENAQGILQDPNTSLSLPSHVPTGILPVHSKITFAIVPPPVFLVDWNIDCCSVPDPIARRDCIMRDSGEIQLVWHLMAQSSRKSPASSKCQVFRLETRAGGNR